jgi:hypothetical protein
MHEPPPWSWDELLSELPTDRDELWASSPSPPGSSATRTKLIDIGVFTVELARDFAVGMSRLHVPRSMSSESYGEARNGR